MRRIMAYSEFMNITSNSSSASPTDIFGPQRDALYIVVPITILYIVIFVTGLIGNVFTCLVIVRNKNMHTATNYYLFSLAVSDLLLLVTGLPQEIYSIWSKWPYIFGASFCLLRGLASETSTNASVLTITLFTTERYLAICHPFLSHKMSKLSRAIRHVAILWVAAFLFALPLALQIGIKYHQGVAMCLQTRVIVEHSFEISTFLFFFAPMMLISVLYSLIGLRLKKSNTNKENQDRKLFESQQVTDRIRRKPSKSTRRVIKMLVAVVVAFFICWAPFHAQRLVAIYGTTEDHQAKSLTLHKAYVFVTYISGVFYYVSTCINPIFYHIMSNKFRDAFKVTVAQICCRKGIRPNIKKYSYTTVGVGRNASSTGLGNPGTPSKNNSNKVQTRRTQSNPENDTNFVIVEDKHILNPCLYKEQSPNGNTIHNCRRNINMQLHGIDNNKQNDQLKPNAHEVHFVNELKKMSSSPCSLPKTHIDPTNKNGVKSENTNEDNLGKNN